MKDIDAFELEAGRQLETDVCIIGGGAAGITIARQLADGPRQVLLMEAGDLAPASSSQALTAFTSTGHPVRSKNEHGQPGRVRCLGGTMNVWGGRCAKLHGIDFRRRKWVPSSGWPIQQEELKPYYRQASHLLKTRWPHRPRISDRERQLLGKGVVEPVDFSFMNPPITMQREYASELRRSRNTRIVLNANATEIEPEPNLTTVRRVRFRTLEGNTFFVKARIYILACGGWENARLLLLSNRYSAKGLGNGHDVLGRYYMEHPIVQDGVIIQNNATLRSPIFLCKRKIRGGYIKQGLRLTDDVQAEAQLLNHYVDLIPVYDEPLDGLPYDRTGLYALLRPGLRSLVDGRYHRQLRDGVEFGAAQILNRPLRPGQLALINHMEQVPNHSSRVTLSREKDALGRNRLEVHLQVSSIEKDSLIRTHRILADFVSGNGIGRFKSGLPTADQPWPDMKDAFHHLGTTRMSDRPETGIVDRNCRVHDVENLFISGSSVFPTGGCVNPTFTIVALAVRLADHIHRSSA